MANDVPGVVCLAVLEETGYISAGSADEAAGPGDDHTTAGEAMTCGAASSGMTC